MDAPASVGLRHGGSVHRCVCVACAQHFADGHTRQPCPMCRNPVEEVLLVF